MIVKIVSVIVLLIICSFLFMIGMMSFGEGYNIANPAIDTRFAAQFDEKKFNKIQIGTDSATIIALIGQPLTIQNLSDSETLWYYTQDGACEWGDFPWLGRELYMYQGKVTAVSKIIHYD